MQLVLLIEGVHENKVDRQTDRPDMTLAIDCGH